MFVCVLDYMSCNCLFFSLQLPSGYERLTTSRGCNIQSSPLVYSYCKGGPVQEVYHVWAAQRLVQTISLISLLVAHGGTEFMRLAELTAHSPSTGFPLIISFTLMGKRVVSGVQFEYIFFSSPFVALSFCFLPPLCSSPFRSTFFNYISVLFLNTLVVLRAWYIDFARLNSWDPRACLSLHSGYLTTFIYPFVSQIFQVFLS